MKTASVRDLRQDFARVLAWVQAGEEVAITRRRQAVARLTPLPHRKPVKRSMPDLAARLTKVFGQRVIADKAMQAIADLDRGPICAYLFHIAAARQLGCEQFLTFDIKQTAMAKAVGLAVKP